jgi:hypothetical protein
MPKRVYLLLGVLAALTLIRILYQPQASCLLAAWMR